jgi:GntR family transcriptional regulator
MQDIIARAELQGEQVPQLMRQSSKDRKTNIVSEVDLKAPNSNLLSEQLLSFRIDKHNPLPIYLQISNFMISVLGTSLIPPGTLLPPERIVCEHIGISKMTLRQAYGVLVQKGLLEAQRGVGTFVLGSRIEKKISGMLSFSEEIRSRGGIPSSRLLSLEVSAASPAAAEFFGLRTDELVYEMKRLRCNDGVPLAFEVVQLPQKLFPDLEKFKWEVASLYGVIEGRYGLKLCQCRSEIMAIPANREQAALLNLRIGSPLLVINRKSHTIDNVPVEFSITYYPGNRYIATFNAFRDGMA